MSALTGKCDWGDHDNGFPVKGIHSLRILGAEEQMAIGPACSHCSGDSNGTDAQWSSRDENKSSSCHCLVPLLL